MSERPTVGTSGKIRVAVVGAGEFGRNHARVYSEMDCVELAGVLDRIRRAAKRLRKSLGFGRSKVSRSYRAQWMRRVWLYQLWRTPTSVAS